LQNTYSATIRGRQDIEIYPQVAGKLTRLCVTEGQVVRAGQPLFIIDQIPYRAALMTAMSNVRAAQAAVATAKLTFDSKSKLYASKVVSAFDVQTAKNAWLTAIAQLGQARAQEISARNNLSYTVVKSPSAGVVGTLPYRVGALVSASLQQPLTTVSDNSQMYVYFSISENQLLDYTQQYGSMEQAIKAFPLVKLMLNNGTEYSQPGKIESISGVIDTQTGTATVRAVFPNKGRLLHSGASGNVVVPYTYKTLHRHSADGDHADAGQDSGLQSRQRQSHFCANVTVAPYNNGQEYVVTSGLNAGDVIIAEGAGLVRREPQ
jgi:membrane fusion protein (multidrug efflux system)